MKLVWVFISVGDGWEGFVVLEGEEVESEEWGV